MLDARRHWIAARDPTSSAPRLSRVLVTSGILGGGITLTLIGVQHLAALPMFITSWTSSSALILSAPRARAARPATIIIAHLLCGGIGLLASAMVAHVPTAIVLAVVLSLFVMLHFRVMHPPAAANPVIALTTAAPHMPLLLGWIGGSSCLAMLALLMISLSGEREPPG